MRTGIEGELATLCESCGLCCDGSLFGCVTLEADEVAGARKHRLHVLPRGNAFEQPCSALSPPSSSGTRRECSVYADRPRACGAFTCRLYERHRRDGGPLEARLDSVRRVRALLASLARTTGDGAITELTRRIEEDFARA